MGGRGSGGHNRKHGRIEDVKYSRVDSFSLKSLLQGDKYLNYKECVEISGEYSTVRYYPCDGSTVSTLRCFPFSGSFYLSCPPAATHSLDRHSSGKDMFSDHDHDISSVHAVHSMDI